MSEPKGNARPPFWKPEFHADRRPLLVGRAQILSAWRSWFARNGFIEVEPAMLQISPGNEAHIGAFATKLRSPDGSNHTLYLHTSPEFACKKLLAAGETRIFSLGKVFRNGERGPLHHPEFTMLEWYRVDASLEVLMDDCHQLAMLAAQTIASGFFAWRDRTCDHSARPERLTVADAFQRHAGIDLAATLDPAGNDRDGLAHAARLAGIRITSDDTWSDIFSKVLSEKIEPALGQDRMTILERYPASEAALARVCPDDNRFAQRFELYACGVELANAFCELTDPHEQRNRFEQEMAERQRIYGERYPIDEDFLAALAHMPDASGIALGVDRLVMLATGATSIDQIIWTPVAG